MPFSSHNRNILRMNSPLFGLWMVTFTVTHLADTFIQSDLQLRHSISAYSAMRGYGWVER